MISKDFTTVTKAVGERQIRVIVSTGDVDRAGDIIDPNGIDFTAYRKNPVVLYQHDHDEPIARSVEIGVVDGRVEALVQFPDEGKVEKSDEVYNLIKAGVLNAVSIGFIPLESVSLDPKDSWGPKRYTKCECIEYSIVSVPCNANALIVERTIGGVNKEDSEPCVDITEKPDTCPTCGQSMPADPVSNEDGCGSDHKPKGYPVSLAKAQIDVLRLKGSPRGVHRG
jgi:HK97 family phage prohead protease